MKKILLPALCLFCFAAAAQNTGIGTTAPTDQLHTTGTVRFQNYAGLGNRLLYIDSAGRIAPPSPGVYFTNNTPVAIPDNGCSSNTGATSTINVSGQAISVPGANIAVRMDISHTFDGDLIVYLIAPNGAVICLTLNAGASGDNYSGTIFEDDAATTTAFGTPPYAGRYKPNGTTVAHCAVTGTVSTFGAIGGGSINPNGTWTLKVFDAAASDVGTLNNWQISFSGANGFGTTGATGPIPYFNGGALALSNIYQSAAGSIGINTVTPSYNLDVTGTLHSTGAATIDGALTANSLTSNNGVTASTLNITGAAIINGALTANSLSSNNGIAGSSLNVTGAAAINGLANIGGTIQIQGGSPAVGKVLTATANTGTATWQAPAVNNTPNSAFDAVLATTYTVLNNSSSYTLLPFVTNGSSGFDDGGTFNNTTNAYVVPATGVYHFDVTLFIATTGNAAATGNGLVQAQLSYPGIGESSLIPIRIGDGLFRTLSFSTTAKLSAGANVQVQFQQYVYGSGSTGINVQATYSRFRGYRVY